jgi:hypothetical protein
MNMNKIKISVSFGNLKTNVLMPLYDNTIPLNYDEIWGHAVDRACKKLYGKNTTWVGDSSGYGMGQVFRPCPTGGLSSVTGRIGLSVSDFELPESHIEALNRADAELAVIFAECRADEQRGEDDFFNGKPMQRGQSYDYEHGYLTTKSMVEHSRD